MRIFLIIINSILFFQSVAQQDTIVVTDYTKVMVGTNREGELFPITSLENSNHAGFFINDIPDGTIRICPSRELFVWVDGELLDVIDKCGFYSPSDLFEETASDTIFVAFSSDHSLADLTCDLIIFEELLVIRDQVSLPRAVRSEFREFVIIALLILLFLLGLIAVTYPSRISYLLEKSLTLKASAYEFVNTGFFTGTSMYVLTFYSLALAFAGKYLDTLLEYGLFNLSETLAEYILDWLQIGVGVFLLFILKWVVISIIAGLFRFRDLKNYQLFDFLNFNLVLLIPALLFLVLDFVLHDFFNTWISSGFMVLFPIMLILFVLWFALKFVNNSTRKKLSIISYLCATEIIPVIILLGWFFK